MGKPYTIGFSVSDKENKFRLATLRLTEDNEELFYHFSHLRNRKKATILLDNNRNDYFGAGITDHVSFHKDGTIHTTHKKYLSNTFRTTHYKLPKNIFYNFKYGIFPLLIESFYFEKEFQESLPYFSGSSLKSVGKTAQISTI